MNYSIKINPATLHKLEEIAREEKLTTHNLITSIIDLHITQNHKKQSMKTFLVIPLETNGAERAFLATENEVQQITPHAEYPVEADIIIGIEETWEHDAKRILRQLGRLPT